MGKATLLNASKARSVAIEMQSAIPAARLLATRTIFGTERMSALCLAC